MKSKNILHVTSIFGTLSSFVGHQFSYNNKKGYHTHFICSPSDSISKYAQQMKCDYLEVPILRKMSLIQDIKAVVNICTYIKKNNIDTVIGYTPKGGLLAMIAAAIMHVPKRYYYRLGLLYESFIGIKQFFFISIERITALFSTRVICISPSIFNKSLTDKLNVRKKQIIIGRGSVGVDTMLTFNPNIIIKSYKENLYQLLNLRETDFIIGFCGRMAKDKGIIELVTAFNNLTTNNNNYKLLIIGPNEDRDVLPEYIEKTIESNPNIIRTGLVPETPIYYSLMDVFILPSYREGFPTVVLEASSMEIPVLTTRSTGCIDSIIEGVTGNFIEINPDSILSAILNPNFSKKELGINGRKFVQANFDQKILWPIIEKELYL